MTKEALWELDQELIAEEETRGKETAGDKEENPSRKFIVKGIVEAFADLTKLHKMFENIDLNTGRFSPMEWNFHGVLSAYHTKEGYLL